MIGVKTLQKRPRLALALLCILVFASGYALAMVCARNEAGAPIVARAVDVHVTSTAQTRVLAYTTPAGSATGWYRVSAYVFAQSANPHIDLYATYTEPHTTTTEDVNMLGRVTSSPGAGLLTGNNPSPGMMDLTVAPLIVEVSAGTLLTVSYQNTDATPHTAPNDYITVFVEWLA